MENPEYVITTAYVTAAVWFYDHGQPELACQFRDDALADIPEAREERTDMWNEACDELYYYAERQGEAAPPNYAQLKVAIPAAADQV